MQITNRLTSLNRDFYSLPTMIQIVIGWNRKDRVPVGRHRK